MNNNKLQQPTTLQKVVNVIGVAFNIICLYYGIYKIMTGISKYIEGKTDDESKLEETEVEEIVVEE